MCSHQDAHTCQHDVLLSKRVPFAENSTAINGSPPRDDVQPARRKSIARGIHLISHGQRNLHQEALGLFTRLSVLLLALLHVHSPPLPLLVQRGHLLRRLGELSVGVPTGACDRLPLLDETVDCLALESV